MKSLIVCWLLSVSIVYAQGVAVSGGRLGQPYPMQNGQQQIFQQHGAQQPLTGKSSISGNVINAVNHEPIKGAEVNLFGAVTLTAVTDEAGHFAFKLLPKGPYSVQAHTPAFSAAPSRGGGQVRQAIVLGDDQQKSGLTISLTPGAAISGRLVDEEGMPLASCGIVAMQYANNQGVKILSQRGGTSTNEKGEYRLTNLGQGNYLMLARCFQTIPLPHAFVRRNTNIHTPVMSYAPLFYPGTKDAAAATKVKAMGGSEVSGIDFRLVPAAGVSITGHLGSTDPEVLVSNAQLTLVPHDPALREVERKGARIDRQSGEFRFDNVSPGSYDLVAQTFGDPRNFQARASIEVGTTDLPPVSLMLTAPMVMTGSIATDGEMKSPLESMQIQLFPTDGYLMGPPPMARVKADGSFTITNMQAGRWLLFVNGGQGSIKSVSLNNRDLESPVLDIAAGGAGLLKIVYSSVLAQVEGTVSGLAADAGQVFALLWPEQANQHQLASRQTVLVDAQGHFNGLNLPPGRYAACAVAMAEPGMLMQNPDVMNALKSRCETVELSTASANKLDLRFVPAQDIDAILAAAEN